MDTAISDTVSQLRIPACIVTKAIQWTLETAAREFGVSRETIKKGLTEAGASIKKGRGASFTTKQIVAAIFGDIKHERFLKTREERTLLELERKQKEGDLIEMDAATDLITRAFLPVRQRLLSLPTEMAARCNPTDPVFAQQALDAWTDRAMKQIQAGISNGKPVKPKRKAAKR